MMSVIVYTAAPAAVYVHAAAEAVINAASTISAVIEKVANFLQNGQEETQRIDLCPF